MSSLQACQLIQFVQGGAVRLPPREVHSTECVYDKYVWIVKDYENIYGVFCSERLADTFITDNKHGYRLGKQQWRVMRNSQELPDYFGRVGQISKGD